MPGGEAKRAIAASEVVRLGARSDRAGLLQLGAHLSLLVCSGALVHGSFGSAWLWPAMLLHGIVLMALFAALHETVHKSAFRTAGLNDVVARVVGFLHFLPAGYFRHFHLAHHRFTQDSERDPELARPKPSTRREYLFWVFGVIHWRDRLSQLWRSAAGRVEADFVPERERRRIALEARLHLLGYLGIGLLALGPGRSAPLYYWILPAILGQPFLRLDLLAEHASCPSVPDPLANSRTTSTHALVRFLMWNMPYHAEHHAYPGVPFHALPALHDRLAPALAVTARGYTVFHRAYARECRVAHR